jgi:uncharacterized protein with PQ loop repeat
MSFPVSTLSPIPQKCLASQQDSSDKLTFFISLFLAVGIVVSYLPQHYRIIARKSSEGISPYFLLLGGTSSSSAFLNILILQKDIIECCRFTVPSPLPRSCQDTCPVFDVLFRRVTFPMSETDGRLNGLVLYKVWG